MDHSTDTKPAAEYLRRMAPTQSHLGRKQFTNAAKLLAGVDVKLVDTTVGPTGLHIFCIPVHDGERFTGWAELTIDAPPEPLGHPVVSAHFRPVEGE